MWDTLSLMFGTLLILRLKLSNICIMFLHSITCYRDLLYNKRLWTIPLNEPLNTHPTTNQTTLITEVDTKVRQVQKTSTDLQRTCEEQRNRILNLESVNAVLKSEVDSLQSVHNGSVTESSKREEMLKQQVFVRSIFLWLVVFYSGVWRRFQIKICEIFNFTFCV